MKRGEEATETYNRLKTLVNKIRSYVSGTIIRGTPKTPNLSW
jgi:hypothetical protein